MMSLSQTTGPSNHQAAIVAVLGHFLCCCPDALMRHLIVPFTVLRQQSKDNRMLVWQIYSKSVKQGSITPETFFFFYIHRSHLSVVTDGTTALTLWNMFSTQDSAWRRLLWPSSCDPPFRAHRSEAALSERTGTVASWSVHLSDLFSFTASPLQPV